MTEFVLVFLSSAVPVAELRGAIPLGIFMFKLSPVAVYFTAVLGNFFIAPFLLIFLKHLSDFLMKHYYFCNRFLNYFFDKTRDHHGRRFEKWEHWALFFLVALPLPFTGAWTACIAAFLFDIPFKKSLAIILLGIMIAGLIVTSLCVFGNGAVNGLK